MKRQLSFTLNVDGPMLGYFQTLQFYDSVNIEQSNSILALFWHQRCVVTGSIELLLLYPMVRFTHMLNHGSLNHNLVLCAQWF